MTDRSRPRRARRGMPGPGTGKRRRTRGESFSGGFVEVGEVAGWLFEAALEAVDEVTGPMEAERYASHIAELWERAGPVLGVEKSAAIGYGVIERLRGSRHPLASALMRALGVVAEEPIGAIAREWSVDPSAWPGDPPGWFDAVGRASTPRAGRIEDPLSDEGTILLFDLSWPNGQTAGLGIFVDPRIGGLAKHILVGPTIAETRAEVEHHEGRPWAFEPLSVGDGAVLARTAIELTEAADDPRIGESYASQRNFVRARLAAIGTRLVDADAA